VEFKDKDQVCQLISSVQMDDEVRPAPRTKARYTGQVRLCTARYRYFSYHLPSIYCSKVWGWLWKWGCEG